MWSDNLLSFQSHKFNPCSTWNFCVMNFWVQSMLKRVQKAPVWPWDTFYVFPWKKQHRLKEMKLPVMTSNHNHEIVASRGNWRKLLKINKKKQLWIEWLSIENQTWGTVNASYWPENLGKQYFLICFFFVICRSITTAITLDCRTNPNEKKKPTQSSLKKIYRF